MKELIEKHKILKDFSYLPLVHTTKFSNAESILSTKGLGPIKEDEVTNEDLLFFFYGRAVYTIHWRDAKKKPSYQVEALPMAFMFECEDVKPAHIFAFDSGGFNSKKYNSTYIGACEISDVHEFELDNYLNVKKMIDLCYKDNPKHNKNYSYYHEDSKDIGDFGDDVLNKYIICLNKGEDRKNKTPEISTLERIPLNKCRAMVLPIEVKLEYEGWPSIEKLIETNNIIVKYYYPAGYNSGNDLCKMVEEKMNQIVIEKGYLN